MTGTELKDERALIFSNLLNGVSEEQVGRAFHKTEAEVQRAFAFVLLKAKAYCFTRQTRRGYPVIVARTVAEAKRYRLTLLEVLPKLNLDREPAFKDIQNEVVTPDNVMSVAKNLNT